MCSATQFFKAIVARHYAIVVSSCVTLSVQLHALHNEFSSKLAQKTVQSVVLRRMTKTRYVYT